jgi:hypothetical protein
MSAAARLEPVRNAGSQEPAQHRAGPRVRKIAPGSSLRGFASSVLRRPWHVLPRDFIHRRRAVRLLADILLIATLSSLAAYAITRSSQGPGFTPPKSVHNQTGSSGAQRTPR